MRRQKLRDDFEGYEMEYVVKEDNNESEICYMEEWHDYVVENYLEDWEEMLVRN